MREKVVIILDSVVYGLDINNDKDIEILSKANPFAYRDCLFITYQAEELLHQIKFDNNAFLDILDFECLDHEIRQSYCPIESGWHWSLPDMLHHYLGIEKVEWEDKDGLQLLVKLKQCYLKMKEVGGSEWERIKNIELPLNKILYKEQCEGIYFNIKMARTVCGELHRNLYRLKNRIQEDYGIIIPKYESFARLIDFSPIEPDHDKLKYYAKFHPELEAFRDLQKAERDYNMLMLIAASRVGNNTCYPMFKGFGSSTGRIFLKEPSLQNMKKTYRKFLIDTSKEEHYKYVYFDYSQFEAGIIAGLTNNIKLKELYNNGRIYDRLAEIAKVDRDTAKTYFYIYAYGEIKAKGTEKFFETYCSSDIFENLLKTYMEKGYVETKLGNRRIIPNTTENQSWLLNHLIQGTSSLIFKQALIDTSIQLSHDERLLLPMHDGALYLLRKEHDTTSIINTYKSAFSKWIPNMDPIVKKKNFFEE